MSISSALSGAQHLAGSGRTSFPVDKTLPRDAYRVLGYRQCGERAVRVDILERLADLIRPALAWREASPGDEAGRRVRRPRLCGDAGDDLADGLGRRGFRLDPARARLSHGAPPAIAAEAGGGARRSRPRRRRWKVAAVAAADVAAEMPAEAVTEAPAKQHGGVAEAAAEIVEQPVSGDPAPSAALLPEVSPLAASEETPAVIEAQPEPVAEAAREQPPSKRRRKRCAAAEAPAEAATEATPEAAAARKLPATAEAPAEPQLVEVWRPGGRTEDRRPRHERHRTASRSAQGRRAGCRRRPGEGDEGEKREGERRHRHHAAAGISASREGAPAEAAAASRRRRGCARRRRVRSRARAAPP